MFLNLFTNIQSRVLHAETQRTNQEEGAAAVEYGLLVALIAVIIIASVAVLGTTLRTKYNAPVTGLGGAAPVVPAP